MANKGIGGKKERKKGIGHCQMQVFANYTTRSHWEVSLHRGSELGY